MADVTPTVADPDTRVPRGGDPEIRLDRRVHSNLGVFRRVWPWGCLGLVGSLLVALAGPRIVDGLELLAHILHPELFPDPPPGALALTVEL